MGIEQPAHRRVECPMTPRELATMLNDDYEKMSQHNVERLEAGDSNVQTGVIFLDMIANLEKIGDHLTNIAERIDLNNNE
jgi:phosphate:Na+ symporter